MTLAMFARLILALLLAAFALPALADGPCHVAPTRMAMHHAGHGLPAGDDRATVPHVCIGCIPPASLATRAPTAPVASTAIARRIVAAAFDPASGTAPALPPPRRNA
jgi:hypothetical protein